MIYDLLTGPLLFASLSVFILGMTYKIWWFINGLDQKLERVAYKSEKKQAIKGASFSIIKWLLPFGTYSWRKQIFASLAFIFLHYALIMLVLFLPAHAMLMREILGFSLPAMPMWLADNLAVLALIGATMFALRRICLAQVRFLTKKNDILILALVYFVLLSGVLARLNMFYYDFWLFMHIFSAEFLLIIAPFTKLSHMILFLFTRAQIGVDYAVKRGGSERSLFPW